MLVRQGFDTGVAPTVREETELSLPIPLYGMVKGQRLVGPGVCRINSQSRQQVILEGNFRLHRSRTAPVRKVATHFEKVEELAPEPPRRTTSLRNTAPAGQGVTDSCLSQTIECLDEVIPLWDGSHPREVDDLIKDLGWSY